MTWVRIESGFLRHRKIIDLPVGAKMLFVAGLCHSAETGTDGHITAAALRILAAELDVKSTLSKALEDAGLWHKREGGWDIHDYLGYQPSAEDERRRRRENADRMQAWRETKKRRRDGRSNNARNTSQDTSRNAEREGARSDERDASCDGPVTLSPNPKGSSNSSLQREVVGAHGCDDDEKLKAVAAHIAAQRIASLAKPPDNPKAYLRTVTASVVDDHGDAIARHLETFPTIGVIELAAMVEPPPPPRSPDPIETTGAARRERDERLAARARGEACGACAGVGVVEQGDGTYGTCEACR